MALKLKDGANADFLEKPDNASLGVPPPKPDDEKPEPKPDSLELQSDADAKPETPQTSADDDASSALQKQIEDLKKAGEAERARSEQLAKERAEAIRIAQEREAEANRYQRQVQDSNYDSINSALAAATSAAEKAQLDIEYAIANGDPKAQADAYRRLARAETAIATLEAGKEELETTKKQAEELAKRQPPQQRRQQADPIDNSGLPEPAKNWLRLHPEYITDARKNAKIQALHYDVLEEGHQAFSTGYFESLEKHLGFGKSNDQPKSNDPPSGGTGGSHVSAPVSRDTPANGGGGRPARVKLTQEQREAAKMSGITEQEYAKRLIQLNELKANGSYGEGR